MFASVIIMIIIHVCMRFEIWDNIYIFILIYIYIY